VENGYPRKWLCDRILPNLPRAVGHFRTDLCLAIYDLSPQLVTDSAVRLRERVRGQAAELCSKLSKSYRRKEAFSSISPPFRSPRKQRRKVSCPPRNRVQGCRTFKASHVHRTRSSGRTWTESGAFHVGRMRTPRNPHCLTRKTHITRRRKAQAHSSGPRRSRRGREL
jgi:hypothetical protein